MASRPLTGHAVQWLFIIIVRWSGTITPPSRKTVAPTLVLVALWFICAATWILTGRGPWPGLGGTATGLHMPVNGLPPGRFWELRRQPGPSR